ncbi:MAG: asparagine synthase (glutamine-hydrolyzing) [Bryobacteraceae bacterium]|jgi:asparagine synthase (glutamine-hydrolysing)
MCGILGAIGLNAPQMSERIVRAANLMSHRGPDDWGTYSDDHAALGFRRLSIIDLSPAGHQPMVSKDGNTVLVFNGEIYNYLELRKELEPNFPFYSQTDSEALLNGYRAWGFEELLQRIDGMFAFAIWDKRTRRVHIARDRAGKKPLFYAHVGGRFLFASTLNSILELHPSRPEIDPQGIDAYLVYQAVPAPLTAFQRVKQLPPAHQLTFDVDSQKLNVKRYWDVQYTPKLKLSEEELLEELDARLRRAVRQRLMSDVKLGAFLSGGVDSSLVVALMAQELRQPVESVVIGFADPAFDERRHARAAARHLNVHLHEHELPVDALDTLPEIIWHYGQPFADPSMVPTYYVAKYARQHVTVVLNGDGGDELFGGYSRPVVARAAAPYKKLVPAGIRRSVGDWFSGTQNPLLRKASLLARAGQYDGYRGFLYERGFQEYRDLMYTDAFRAETSSIAPSEYYRAVWEQADGCDDVDRVLCLDFKTYLPDQLLTKMDVSTMAHSVEARSPLLSKELIEFAALIPASLRLRGYNTKYLLKKLAARYVPPEIVYRKKRGFVMPISAWLRGELAGSMRAVLQSRSFVERDWIRPDSVNRMIAEHASEQRNWSEQLWTLFVLELWARTALDNTLDRDVPLHAVA